MHISVDHAMLMPCHVRVHELKLPCNARRKLYYRAEKRNIPHCNCIDRYLSISASASMSASASASMAMAMASDVYSIIFTMCICACALISLQCSDIITGPSLP